MHHKRCRSHNITNNFPVGFAQEPLYLTKCLSKNVSSQNKELSIKPLNMHTEKAFAFLKDTKKGMENRQLLINVNAPIKWNAASLTHYSQIILQREDTERKLQLANYFNSESGINIIGAVKWHERHYILTRVSATSQAVHGLENPHHPPDQSRNSPFGAVSLCTLGPGRKKTEIKDTKPPREGELSISGRVLSQ